MLQQGPKHHGGPNPAYHINLPLYLKTWDWNFSTHCLYFDEFTLAFPSYHTYYCWGQSVDRRKENLLQSGFCLREPCSSKKLKKRIFSTMQHLLRGDRAQKGTVLRFLPRCAPLCKPLSTFSALSNHLLASWFKELIPQQ